MLELTNSSAKEVAEHGFGGLKRPSAGMTRRGSLQGVHAVVDHPAVD